MMNTWLSPTCVVIEYTDDEWEFIESLPHDAQRRIYMGLATPYNYGYKLD